MKFTIKEKNPGPKVIIKKNDEVIVESGVPQTNEQVVLAKGENK
jgi:hypothetical protein